MIALARWLGISHRIGSDMCYWLITESGQIISKSSVQHVIKEDFLNPDVKETIEKFNKRLVERLNDSNHRVELPEGAEKYRLPDIPLPDDLEHDERDERNIPRDDEYGDMLVDERPDDDEEEIGYQAGELVDVTDDESEETLAAAPAELHMGAPAGVGSVSMVAARAFLLVDEDSCSSATRRLKRLRQ